MLKIFLVEDEKAVRMGIQKRIRWEEWGMELVGEAGDGEMAYPMILEKKPDILITDVQMPFMDGLELSELVKKELPGIRIILISGFEEFTYASRALKLGVMDYLMKPVNRERLGAVLQNAGREIREERKKKRYQAMYEEEQERKLWAERYRFFGELVSGQYSVSELLSRGKRCGLELSAKAYNLILIHFGTGGDHRISGKKEELEAQLRYLAEEQEGNIYFDRGSEGGALLIKGRGEDDIRAKTKSLKEEIRKVFEDREGCRYFTGTGGYVTRLGDLPVCFEAASRVFAQRFFGERGRRVDDQQGPEEETPDLDGGIRKEIRLSVEAFLREGSQAEIQGFTEAYFRIIRRKKGAGPMMRQYLLMSGNMAVLCFLEKQGSGKEPVGEAISDMAALESASRTEEGARTYMEGILERALGVRDSICRRKKNEMVTRAKEFIHRFYAQEEISLQKVADYVQVSPNYFSRVFSRQEGKTFVEYLTGLRMEQARILLRCTSKTVAEIGKSLGYKDSQYFYYLFKKTVGCTPRDYRIENAG